MLLVGFANLWVGIKGYIIFLIAEAYINRLEKLHQSLKEEIVRITNQVVVTENELKELQQSYQLKCSSEQQLSSKLSMLSSSIIFSNFKSCNECRVL